MNTPVFRFRKNAIHEIHFELAEHEGKRHVDIRVWALSGAGEFVPTSRPGGINFPLSLFEEFLEGVEKLKMAVTESSSKTGKKKC